MKKIFLWIMILFCLFFWNISFLNTINAWLKDSSFMIETWKLWLGWTEINTWWTAENTIEDWLEIIVNKMMIALWVLTLFIMTIGWWYMIFAHGQDDLLNKWKSIFTSWLIALVVALSSWIIMKIVISLLYD